MARRATPVTKGRTALNKVAPPAAPVREPAAPARRSAKAKSRDEAPIEMPIVAAPIIEHDAPAESAPAKMRRGRKSKPEMTADEAEGVPEAAMPHAEPMPAEPKPPRKTRRNREPEASAPPPLETVDDMPNEENAIEAAPAGTHAAAAEWHAATDSVTFDWPAIEEVATVEGVNQPMAKLLLAARAEGARSRWPF